MFVISWIAAAVAFILRLLTFDYFYSKKQSEKQDKRPPNER